MPLFVDKGRLQERTILIIVYFFLKIGIDNRPQNVVYLQSKTKL